MRFSVGDRVSQPQYGPGTITALDERHTVINFDEHGTRTFATPMVKLEPSSIAQPPPPPRRTRRKKEL